MSKVQKIAFTVEGVILPVKVYKEKRRNVRFSFGKDAILFRMPSGLSVEQEKKYWAWFQTTLTEKLQAKPALKTHYTNKIYQNGDQLVVGSRTYTLMLEKSNLKTHRANLRNGVIHLQLASESFEFETQKVIRTLLSRIIAKDFKPHITRRVLELNALYFKKDIKSVNLKYNQSNWGSCSTRTNINLSTRLLFAPDDVIDYVIIHELAHLIEMNHSNRFWALVEEAMPDYKEKEKWLKENRALCDF